MCSHIHMVNYIEMLHKKKGFTPVSKLCQHCHSIISFILSLSFIPSFIHSDSQTQLEVLLADLKAEVPLYLIIHSDRFLRLSNLKLNNITMVYTGNCNIATK